MNIYMMRKQKVSMREMDMRQNMQLLNDGQSDLDPGTPVSEAKNLVLNSLLRDVFIPLQ